MKAVSVPREKRHHGWCDCSCLEYDCSTALFALVCGLQLVSPWLHCITEGLSYRFSSTPTQTQIHALTPTPTGRRKSPSTALFCLLHALLLHCNLWECLWQLSVRLQVCVYCSCERWLSSTQRSLFRARMAGDSVPEGFDLKELSEEDLWELINDNRHRISLGVRPCILIPYLRQARVLSEMDQDEIISCHNLTNRSMRTSESWTWCWRVLKRDDSPF